LIGPQGERGPTGLTGSVGPQGLIGLTGLVGENGKNSLIKTSNEPAGGNCSNGGIKLEVGLDQNQNGTLDSEEIDNNFSKFICNSILEGVNSNSNIHGVVNLSEGQSLNWIVPNGVFTIQLIVNGSRGGDSGQVCNHGGTCWPFSRGSGGGFATGTFNINVIPGQTFSFLVGVNGINGSDSNSTSFPGVPGTEGTLTKVDLNGIEILSISGGTGGVSGVGGPQIAPGPGTNGRDGQVFYTLGKGLLNLQTSLNQSFYNLNESVKIRIEY
jgi:hypothetical protein